MSLSKRQSAVGAAEARAADCIARARAKVAASRDQGDSQVFPVAVVASGMLAGIMVERKVGGEPRRRPKASSADSSNGSPGWLSLAHLGMAMRLWRELGPLLGAGGSAAGGAGAAAAGEEAMTRGGGAKAPPSAHV